MCVCGELGGGCGCGDIAFSEVLVVVLGDGGEGVGCIRQLLLRQLLMSEKQQLAGLPEETLPANSQMEGLGLEGRRG